MAKNRPAVPPKMKAQLVEQAGHKCANPGCANVLVELHHIREWHIYQTHDADHMIALCPACHDSVNRGDLQISDDDVYAWKGIDRAGPRVGHIFVEPGNAPPRILLGTLSAQGVDDGLVAFDLADTHRLGFAVRDNDIMLLNLRIANKAKQVLVEVIDGYVRTRRPDIQIHSRPGHIRIPAGFNSQHVPQWVRQRLLAEDLSYGIEGMPLLEIRVVRPGLVRVNGLWVSDNSAVIITNQRLSFVQRELTRPLTLLGAGEDTVLKYTGSINTALFKVA